MNEFEAPDPTGASGDAADVAKTGAKKAEQPPAGTAPRNFGIKVMPSLSLRAKPVDMLDDALEQDPE
jgi:hypothetical protein